MLDRRIDWVGTPQARAAVAALGRTEDVHWSPDGRQIAIAAFARNQVLLLAVDCAAGVRVCAPRWIVCAQFRMPHGVFWMDNHHLVVANRGGGVCVVAVPPPASGEQRVEVEPLAGIVPGRMQVRTPGSVCALSLGGGVHELLVCNNYVNRVSSHLVDARNGLSIRSGAVLLEAGLGVPDGVAVSPDGAWIAVSNHDHNSVFVYRNAPELDAAAGPDAVLEGLAYPHGLRFTPDGHALLVADAGAPEIHCFRRGAADWSGRRQADRVCTVLDEADFRAGQYNPQEGGPKGIALSPDGAVLAMTCAQRTLDFFDARELQEAGAEVGNGEAVEARLRAVLLRQLPQAFEAMERLQSVEKSRVWRWTQWLYRLEQAVRQRRRRRRESRRRGAAR